MTLTEMPSSRWRKETVKGSFAMVSLLAALLTSLASAADWPTYRADAARSGYTAEALGDELRLQWTHTCRHAPRPAWPTSDRMHYDFVYQPIVASDTVVFGTSADDQVVALDAATGQVRWRFFAQGPIRFAPAAWRDRVFVASDDGCLYTLALSDGRLLWTHRGGPDDRLLLGNERMISRWPARGGPVVLDDTVYYALGIWPSDGVYLHALDAQSGKTRWTNSTSGSIYMAQPHGGANANSGVPPQGYLAANAERLFVPTGRAVPAAFRRADGALDYYRLEANHSIGGARALLAGPYLANGGCLFEPANGQLAARFGRGVLSALPDGMIQSNGSSLICYRFADMKATDRKGQTVRYRGLDKVAEVVLRPDPHATPQMAKALEKYPVFKDMFDMRPRYRQAFDGLLKQSNLEVMLNQSRPELQQLGVRTEHLLATTYERDMELIAAGNEAIRGGRDVVEIVDLARHRVSWQHPVEGTALGLAVSGGRLLVSTTQGRLYCFAAQSPRAIAKSAVRPEPTAGGPVAAVNYAAAAEAIMQTTGVAEGLCVDLGCGTGELAMELARRSKLTVVGLEEDPSAVDAARKRLDAAGLYGVRVSIQQGNPLRPAYPRHCVDLVVSSRALQGDTRLPAPTLIAALLHPHRGKAALGKPGKLNVVSGKPLDGAGQWTHQNASPANTLCSDDRLVKGPLEMRWFRDVDFEIPDRHAQGPTPLVNHGHLVVEGIDGICCLDAYNGRLLWSYRIDGILRDWDGSHHDVGVPERGNNFCLGDESVYVAEGARCLRLDLRSGKLLGEFPTPAAKSSSNRNWGYIAYHDGLLYGSVLNDEHTTSARYTDIRLRTESTLFFALDARNGRPCWRYAPRESIRNNAITIAGDRVYLIDRAIALADHTREPEPGRKIKLLKPGEQPGGSLLALDARTGRQAWKTDDNIFGTQLAVSLKHGVLLMHYQSMRFNFFRLPSELGDRMAAFDLRTGKRLWDKAVKHKTRPVIIDDTIYCEGGAWKVCTGEEVLFKFNRQHGCGQIAASSHLLVFRSATLAYLDLDLGSGIKNFGGMRPGCWINAIPAGGLVLVPDGSAKCLCSYQTRAWFALQPSQVE
jgi:outer membrane protein assembly factor BamB